MLWHVQNPTYNWAPHYRTVLRLETSGHIDIKRTNTTTTKQINQNPTKSQILVSKLRHFTCTSGETESQDVLEAGNLF